MVCESSSYGESLSVFRAGKPGMVVRPPSLGNHKEKGKGMAEKEKRSFRGTNASRGAKPTMNQGETMYSSPNQERRSLPEQTTTLVYVQNN